MEANICDVNHLDADVLLPPRKRLLAGLKKQSSKSNGALSLSLIASSAPASTASSAALSHFETRLNNLLNSHSNNPNRTPGEIVEASKSAAIAASKAAEAARAAAEEKAAIASKATAAAKRALDLVASFSEEAVCKERYLKKNKLKKHLPVQLLYKKYRPIENNKTDEELARKLHRAMNSSPRISKHSSSSDWKGHKHKKPKSSASSVKSRVSNGVIVSERHLPSMSNGLAVTGKTDSVGSIQELYSHKADDKSSMSDKAGQVDMDNEEAESSQPKDKTGEDVSKTGKRRGRVKLRRLPLSIFNFRDQSNPKEEMNVRSSPLSENKMGSLTTDGMPLFSMQPSADDVMPIGTTAVWKCQEFNVSTCVKQNKVLQS